MVVSSGEDAEGEPNRRKPERESPEARWLPSCTMPGTTPPHYLASADDDKLARLQKAVGRSMHVSHGLPRPSIPRTAKPAGASIHGDRRKRRPIKLLATPEGQPSTGSVPAGYSYLKDVFDAAPLPVQAPYYATAPAAPHRRG